MRFRHPLIYVSLWCMLMAAATARGAVTEGILGFVSSLVLWGIFYTVGLASGFANAGMENPGNTKITNAVAVAGIAVFLLMLLSQGLLPALLTFVLWIQGAQNFSLGRPRDLFFALAISFVTILFAASESKSGLFLLCMGLYTLSAVCTLTALYFEQQSQEARAVAQVEGKLRLPSGMGLLTAVILTAGALLYLCMPQPPATHVGAFFAGGGPYYGRSDWQTDAGKGFQKDKDRGKAAGTAADEGGQTAEAPGAYQGFSQDLALDSTSAGTKLDPNALLMYVRADRPLYLRGRTFDTFQDDHWVNSEPQTEKLDVETHHVDLRPNPGGPTSVETVEVVAPVTDLIFAASRADELEFPGTVIARDRDGALYAPRVLEKGTLYSVSYDQQLADGHPLGEPASLASDDTYLQLPADLDSRVPALAKQVVGTRTDLAAAEAIESYLRSHYQYTLDTVGQPGYTPLSKFLFQTKRGHCEYFATAMVMMLRSVGIPSRLVTGVSAHERNPFTGYYQVRAIDGHAWAEGKIAGLGWVTFEATPFYFLPSARPPARTPAAGLVDYVAELAREAQTVDPQGLRTAMLTHLKHATTALKSSLSKVAASIASWVWRLIVLAALLSALVAVAFILHRRSLGVRLWALRKSAEWRLWRARRHGLRAYVLACYLESERLLAAIGLPRQDAVAVADYARQVSATLPPDLRDVWATLVDTFTNVRYGGAEVSKGEASATRAAANRLLAGLGKGSLHQATAAR